MKYPSPTVNSWNEKYLIMQDRQWLNINILLVTPADLRHFLPFLLRRHIPSTVELKQKLLVH